MITGIYAFRDKKIGYMQPFLQQNQEVAIRTLKIAVNDAQSTIRRMAEDIDLYMLGTFDDESGEIKPAQKYIASAINYREELQ